VNKGIKRRIKEKEKKIFPIRKGEGKEY